MTTQTEQPAVPTSAIRQFREARARMNAARSLMTDSLFGLCRDLNNLQAESEWLRREVAALRHGVEAASNTLGSRRPPTAVSLGGGEGDLCAPRDAGRSAPAG